ncbi:hypothetical protein OC861_005794 [Tilletia horrida]|nr:hypothetical protein OC845_001787 [Tilletia horrida]KAK0561499.1 hypothetical protein OC861_005794 [Tilletia horrida]
MTPPAKPPLLPTASSSAVPTVQPPVASAVDISVNTRGATLLPEEGSHPDQRDSRAIYLPNHVEAVSHIAVDIGGSLAKLVYFTRAPDDPDTSDFQAASRSRSLKGSFGSGSDRTSTPPLSSHHLVGGGGTSPSPTPFRTGTPVASGTLTPTSIHRGKFFEPSATVNGSPFSPPDSKFPVPAGPPKPAAPLPPPDPAITAAATSTTTASNIAGSTAAASSSTLPSEISVHTRLQPSPLAPSSSTSGTTTIPPTFTESENSLSSLRASFLKRRSLPPILPGGRLNFVKFETEHIEQCVSFLAELLSLSARANGVSLEEMRRGVKLTATGGGAHMYKELFERELGIEVQREDEMSCLITGLNFITLIPDEVFWLSDELVEQFRGEGPRVQYGNAAAAAAAAAPQNANAQSASSSSTSLEAPQLPRPSPNPPSYMLQFDSSPSPKLPCLLVNIGSGVSIIRVDEFGAFERVSGTSLGGGTLWGLLSLLTGAGSFDEMLALSEQGDNAKVDMLVGDIYGQVGYNTLGLKSTTIASSFGKVFRRQDAAEDSSAEEDDEGPLKRDRAPGVKTQPVFEGEDEETAEQARDRRNRERRRKQNAFAPEDICKSLLYAISNNIGQIAYMNAEKYGLDRIYFSGCFIRGHHATINTLSYAIRFWSKGTKRALFLRHEGYLGAVGAWIRQVGGEGSAPIVSEQQEASQSVGVAAPTRPEPVRSTGPIPIPGAVPTTATVGSTTSASNAHAQGISPTIQAQDDDDEDDEKKETKLVADLEKLTPADRAILEPLFKQHGSAGVTPTLENPRGSSALSPLLPRADPSSDIHAEVQSTTTSLKETTQDGDTAAVLESVAPTPATSRPVSMAASAQDDWMSLMSGVYAAEQARVLADRAEADSSRRPQSQRREQAISGPGSVLPNGTSNLQGADGKGVDLVNGGDTVSAEEEEEEEEGDGEGDGDDDTVSEEAVLRQLTAANPELAELLSKLDNAEGAADGLEQRLDGLLQSLDGILDRIE